MSSGSSGGAGVLDGITSLADQSRAYYRNRMDEQLALGEVDLEEALARYRRQRQRARERAAARAQAAAQGQQAATGSAAATIAGGDAAIAREAALAGLQRDRRRQQIRRRHGRQRADLLRQQVGQGLSQALSRRPPPRRLT